MTEEMNSSVAAAATGLAGDLLDGISVAGQVITARTVVSVDTSDFRLQHTERHFARDAGSRACLRSHRRRLETPVVLNDRPRLTPECRLRPGERAWPYRPSGLRDFDSLPVSFPAEALEPR